MTSEKIRFGQLCNYLAFLGYDRSEATTHVVYRKSGHELPIILPRMPSGREVPSFNITAVEEILRLDGVEASQAAILEYRASNERGTPEIKASKDETSKVKAAKVTSE